MNDLNTRKFTIEQARVLSGLSQDQMAKELGMSTKTYLNREKYRGVLRMDEADKLSKLSGINIGNIIFFQDKLRKISS